MATRRTWIGGSQGDWTTPSNWSPAGVPAAGDTVVLDTTTALLNGLTLDGLDITISSDTSPITTSLDVKGTTTLTATTRLQVADGASALMLVPGTLSVAGTIAANGAGVAQQGLYINGAGSVQLGTTGRITAVQDTVVLRTTLANAGIIDVSGGGNLYLDNAATNTGTIHVSGGLLGQNGLLTNHGTVSVEGGNFYENSGVTGTGSLRIASGALYVGGSIATGQTVQFGDAYGLLSVGDPSLFAGTITQMQRGDILDLYLSKADAATVSNGMLTISMAGVVVASYPTTLADGALAFSARDDGGFGTLLLTSVATRTWKGGAGSWYDPAQWVTTGGAPSDAPLPGDTVHVTGGTVTLAGEHGTLLATEIDLAGTEAAPATLALSNATLDSTSSVQLDGAAQFARIAVSGSDTIQGLVKVSSQQGRLTFELGGGTNPGYLTLASSAGVAAGTGAAVRFTGGMIENDGLVNAYGRVTFTASTSLSGSGIVQVETGGVVVIDGSVASSQTVVFADTSGRLEIGNLAAFAGSIESFEPGDVIDFKNVVATGATLVDGVLTLTNAGVTVGTVYVDTSTYYDSSPQGVPVVKADGAGGTTVGFMATDPIVLDASMPLAAVGGATGLVSFRQLLIAAFGSVPAGYASYTLSPTATNTDFTGYWGQAQQTPPGTPVQQAWFVNGTEVRGKPVRVAAADIDKVQFRVGNPIDSTASFSVTVQGTDAAPGEILRYHMWSVDPNVNTFVPGTSVPDAASQVASIDVYNAYYTNVQNSDYCPWIADDVAAGHGATMPWQNESTDPNNNQEGGFWRIVHNGTKTPVADWYTLLKAGDVVRMGWAETDGDGVGQHTTSIYQVVPDGASTVALVWDNNDYKNFGSVDYIGLHPATYWDATFPQTITIYRLDPNQQYLVNGTGTSEIIQGSVFNNLIRPGGGGDTITAGAGTNEIQGAAADLDGDTVTDFHLGDSLDVTDLAAGTATLAYDATSGLLTLGGTRSAAVRLPKGLVGGFLATDDGSGGTLVSLACYLEGTRIGVPGNDEGVAVESLAIGDLVTTVSGAARPIRWIGRRRYSGRFAAANGGVHPVRFRAGSLGDGRPRRDLLVSPKHAMLLDGVLVPAEALVNGVSVIVDHDVADISYVHIEFETHDVLWAEGVASESFVDDDSRGLFQNAHEYAALYPDAPRRPAAYCAPRIEGGEVLAGIRAAIDRRAGIAAPAAAADLRGGLLGWEGSVLLGWAQDPARPDAPVCLDVLVDGIVVTRVLADQFQASLRGAGLGSGRNGFRAALPAGRRRGAVEVRRSGDGARLAVLPGDEPAARAA